jgi:hypothetical protein
MFKNRYAIEIICRNLQSCSRVHMHSIKRTVRVYVDDFTTEMSQIYDAVLICLGRQTKQIIVGKFQTLMCLFANTESSPNSSKRLRT